MDRAPSFVAGTRGAACVLWLRPGAPAAPEGDRLRLLPSGPDLVHGPPPPRDRAINAQHAALTLGPEPRGRGFSPARADCGYRAPLAPRLARSARIVALLHPRRGGGSWRASQIQPRTEGASGIGRLAPGGPDGPRRAGAPDQEPGRQTRERGAQTRAARVGEDQAGRALTDEAKQPRSDQLASEGPADPDASAGLGESGAPGPGASDGPGVSDAPAGPSESGAPGPGASDGPGVSDAPAGPSESGAPRPGASDGPGGPGASGSPGRTSPAGKRPESPSASRSSAIAACTCTAARCRWR